MTEYTRYISNDGSAATSISPIILHIEKIPSAAAHRIGDQIIFEFAAGGLIHNRIKPIEVLVTECAGSHRRIIGKAILKAGFTGSIAYTIPNVDARSGIIIEATSPDIPGEISRIGVPIVS